MNRILTLLTMTLFAAVQVNANEDVSSSTVIGPRNPFLYDGAHALMANDAEEGVRLTLIGLKMAQGNRELSTAHSNLCAGFLLLGQAETALEHCDQALEIDATQWRTYNNRALVYLRLERFDESEADIKAGQELNPRSEKLKEVKGLYLDEVEPVEEKITIDDRRKQPPMPVQDPQP